MKNYIFSSRRFSSEGEMEDFVNHRDFVKQVVSVIKEGSYYTLFYLW
jgi:hypothetical protein